MSWMSVLLNEIPLFCITQVIKESQEAVDSLVSLVQLGQQAKREVFMVTQASLVHLDNLGCQDRRAYMVSWDFQECQERG